MSADELLGPGDAQAWLRQHWPRPAARRVPLREAVGRVAAADIHAPAAWPAGPSAREDGVAVVAADSEGAGVYAPARLPWCGGRAARVTAGEPLPPPCDAVAAYGGAAIDAEGVSLTAPVAVGAGVRHPGADAGKGDLILQAGRRVGPFDEARLAALGVGELACRAPLPVTLLAAHRDPAADATATLLARLLQGSGAEVHVADRGIDAALAAATATPGLVLAHGGSGEWPDDPLAQALAGHGELAARAVAVQPGMGTRLGRVAGSLVVALPGQPWPAFAALWLLLRAPLGLSPVATGQARLVRKLSSPLGVAELVPLAREGDGVVPLPRDAVLPPARLAGVVTVPEESEGHAAGEALALDWLEARMDG